MRNSARCLGHYAILCVLLCTAFLFFYKFAWGGPFVLVQPTNFTATSAVLADTPAKAPKTTPLPTIAPQPQPAWATTQVATKSDDDIAKLLHEPLSGGLNKILALNPVNGPEGHSGQFPVEQQVYIILSREKDVTS